MGGFTSTSDAPNPVHTFENGSNQRTIVHTVTIVINGQPVIYTCTKTLNFFCSNTCNENSFNYAVNGCTVAFAGLIGGAQQWDFGDGTLSNMTNPTHTYAVSGDHVVTFRVSGLVCQKTIRVNCGSVSPCCTADFSASLYRECSALWLKLDAGCDGGSHNWTISTIPANACLTLVNFNAGMADQLVQVTNINTAVTTDLVVKHTYTCSDGAVSTSTRTFSTSQLQGIYIGKMSTPSGLNNDYGCVLPGAGYNGSTIVYSSGIVQIDKSFEFAAADVRMHPEAGFDVQNGHTFTIRQNAIVHGNTEPSCNCLWRGINVMSGATLSTSSNAVIEDALYAARAFGSSTLSIRKTHFNRNFVGIRATNGFFTLSPFVHLIGSNGLLGHDSLVIAR